MKRLWLAILALLFVPMWALAQSDDGGRIERLIERSLSDTGRTVEITGFQGALRSAARFDRLTIADETGIWLTIDDAVLDWTFSALARGTLQVAELSAARIDVARAPIPPETDLPSAEASGFRIPDLPVALVLDALSVAQVTLGESLLGAPVALQIDGRASLSGGALDVELGAQRTDGQRGALILNAANDPGADTLRLDISLSEAPGGLVARSLNIPGLPSVDLSIQGDGPLDAYRADIGLRTDGQDRLNGEVVLTGTSSARAFDASLLGDIRPLLDAETQNFFGPETRVSAQGVANEDGGLQIDALELETAQLRLNGSIALASGGAPEAFTLDGTLSGDGDVTLPGTDIVLSEGTLALTFDAEVSPDWQMSSNVTNLRASGAQLSQATLSGAGQIMPGSDTPFTGQLTLATDTLALDDIALQRAIGPSIQATVSVAAQSNGQVELSSLTVDASHLAFRGNGMMQLADGAASIALDGQLDVPDLSPFEGLAAPLKAGRVAANVTATMTLPGGTFAFNLEGRSEGIDVGIPRLKALLEPQATLLVSAKRDETGSQIETLQLTSSDVTLQGHGAIDSASARGILSAELTDAALIDASLSGPATIALEFSGDVPTRAFDGDLEVSVPGANVSGDFASRAIGDDTNVDLDVALDVPDLGIYAKLAAPLQGGRLNTRMTGDVSLPSGAANLRLEGETANIDLGIAELSPLLEPVSVLTGQVQRRGTSLRFDQIAMASTAWRSAMEASITGSKVSGSLDATLLNLADFIPDANGQATVTVTGEGDLDAQMGRAEFAAQAMGVAWRGVLDAAERVTLRSTLDAPALSGLANLARPLRSGSAQAQINAEFAPSSGEGSLTVEASTQDIDIGQPALRPLLSPRTVIFADVARTTDGIDLNELTLRNQAVTARAMGAQRDGDAALDITARLDTLARLVPELPGQVDLTAALTNLLSTPNFDATITSARGLNMTAAGKLGLPGGAVDIAASGRAPLALAQPFLGRRVIEGDARFDLGIQGTPNINAARGTVNLENARFSDPALNLVLDPINGRIDLSGGAARISATAQQARGSLALDGQVTLSAPFQTSLDVALRQFPLAYEDVAQSTLDGQLSVSGPAQSRLSVTGGINLSDTNLRVPDTGLGGAPPIPEIRHIGASQSVRQTLERAGYPGQSSSQTNGSGPNIPLDISVQATTPIFVRGRGLDAEFGGAVRLTGTAANPVPVGAFELRRGRLDFLGRRFDLTEGVISAAGRLVPRLRIVAEAVTEDVTGQIILEGPADAPQLTLSSVPELPQDEVLAVIIFGKTAANLSALQVTRLITSLAQLSGRGGGGGILNQTRETLGFDDLDLRTDAKTGETELAIGRYISDNVYSEVEVDAGGGAQLNLNLDLTDNTKVRGSVSSTGQTGIGLFWQKDY